MGVAMNAVATKVIDQAPAPVAEGATLLAVISRAASDPNVDIDKMERLMEMHRDMQRQQAEAAFNTAMARVQSRMGRIGTDRTNKQTSSDYATYAKLDRELRPLYSAEGFALSFGTDPVDAESIVRVTCHVTHAAGFTRKYLIDMPADGKGAKGNDVMTKTHATGSATQYGMRYLLKMIFNVAIGEDDDGNAAGSDEAAVILAEWIQVVSDCKTPAELAKRKQELTDAYGGVGKVPQSLKSAATAKAAALGGAK
jgi:hypothetical protein